MKVEDIPGFFVEFGTDNRVIYMNAAMSDAVNWKPQAGLVYLDALVHEDDRSELRRALEGTVNDGNQATLENRIQSCHGERLDVLWHIKPVLDEGGAVLRFYAFGADVTRMRSIERALTDRCGALELVESERAELAERLVDSEVQLHRLSTALEQIADHAVITDREGRIEYVNRAFEQVTGYTRAQAIGKTMQIVKSGRHDDAFYAELWRTILDGKVFYGEFVNRTAQGHLFFDEKTISPLRDETGAITHFMATGRDVSDRKMRDPLTGLPTHTLLLARVDEAIARKRRDKEEQFALLFVDLDRFKLVNDTYGTTAGDQVLMEIAYRIRSTAREVDAVVQVSHVDRDEFAVLLEGLRHPSDGRRVAERILEAIREPVLAGVHETSVTASVGIALSTTPYERAADMVRDAETAMGRAKAHPEEPCQVFDPTMHSRAVARLGLERDLRLAIEKKQFVLHYQPIVSLETGLTEGCEALVRWQHPKRGMVPPMDFIPLSEETGLVVPLGMLVLREACEQAKVWLDQGMGQLSVAVNLSARQFRQRNLVSAIQSVLFETGLPSGLLKLEITETAAAADPKAAIETLTELKALGIQLLMDDFGTGYSCLSFLTRFPLDKLKIDRSFVMKTPGSHQDNAVASTIVAMAHNLGMGVIAEGVETREQLEFLRSLGCGQMQGYLFSPPVPAERFSELVRSGKRLEVA